MAADVESHETPEPVTGLALLWLFAAATVVAVFVIALVIAAPSVATLAAAMLTVIGFAAGIVAILARLIGADEHDA